MFLALLSPAKKLREDAPPPPLPLTTPALLGQTLPLAEHMRTHSAAQLETLMHISPALASLNHERFQRFSSAPLPNHARAALLMFQGDVYQGLDAASLTEDQLHYAQSHLRILSGLYGLLRPMDAMQPYRLEMGTRLATEKGKDLYQFWGNAITQQIEEDAAKAGAEVILNLASQEYAKAVRPDQLSRPFITLHFKEWKQNGWRTIGLMAKRARGKMARFLLAKQPVKLDILRDFDYDGYKYLADASTEQDWVFGRGNGR